MPPPLPTCQWTREQVLEFLETLAPTELVRILGFVKAAAANKELAKGASP